MFKKIIPWILLVVVMAAGGYGTFRFYRENKANIESLNNMTNMYNSARAELDSIGTMINVYAISTDVLSGDEIRDTDIITVSIPEQAAGSTVVRADAVIESEDGTTTPAVDQFVGKHYRCNYSKGTLLTTEMLMTDEEEVEGIMKFPIELTFSSLPVTLVKGDYIDLRFLIANGEEYVILDHKIVRDIYNTTITLWVSEEENVLINSMYSDLGVYPSACVAYLFKYLEPGNTQTLSFYPCSAEVEKFLKYHPNITDITRCVNTNLRQHIDSELAILSDSANSGVSSSIISTVSSALSNQSAMRQQWLQDQEQKEQEAQEAGVSTDDTGEVTETQEVIDTEAIE